LRDKDLDAISMRHKYNHNVVSACGKCGFSHGPNITYPAVEIDDDLVNPIGLPEDVPGTIELFINGEDSSSDASDAKVPGGQWLYKDPTYCQF
jgi:hypothetical protein